MESHVTEEDLLRLDAGTLEDGDYERVSTHVEQCVECSDRHASEMTRRDGPNEIRPAARPRMTMNRGTLLGRYVVIEVLGRGGMGVVYTAYDPELDRRVAIKLLQARQSGGARDQAWLLREAQALARLSHPNVVAVHDVGTLPGDRVFVAMEHVDGDTLRDWLDEPRPWQEVVPIMIAAGTGLAAAHAAGLVHRDFKPENVLVGTDGRVRVMDFGLARLQADHTPPVGDIDATDRSHLADNLTKVGAVIGTPAYIAPELHERQPAGPRSDQFAFGVTLFEALYRMRPFTDSQLAIAALEPLRPREVPRAGVPAHIHEVAMRAIAADPAARFADMTALLDRLRVPVRSRRTGWIALGLGGVAAAATAFAVFQGGNEATVDPCGGGEARLAGVWDAPAKAAAKSAFLASHRSHAQDTFVRVEDLLDRYAAGWVTQRRAVCEATETRHEQSPIAFDLRMRCLTQRLDTLRALTAVFARADRAITDNAVLAARDLPAVDDCATLVPDAKPPPSAVQAPLVAELEHQLAELIGTTMADRYGRGIAQATPLLARARQVGYEPLTAQVLFQMAIAQMGGGQQATSEQTLREALGAAADAKDDALVAQIWISLIWVVGQQAGHAEAALAMRTAADVAIRRAGEQVRPKLAGDLQYSLAHAYFAGGDMPHATAAFEAALALRTKAVTGRDTDAWKLHSGLGAAQLRSGNLFGAKDSFEKTLALLEELHGPRHPGMVVALSNLAALEQAMNNFDKAYALHERALAISDEVNGPDHEQSALLLYSLATSKNGLEDYRAAVPLYESALAVLSKAAPEHGYIALILVGLADCREEIGDAKRAVPEAERGLALLEKGNDAMQLAYARYVLAKALWSAGERGPRPRALGEEARKGFAASGILALHALHAVEKWFAKIDGKR